MATLLLDGPLAQVVEQLAFNQRVGGSSPPRLTFNRTFRATELVAFSFVYSFIYRCNRTSADQANKQTTKEVSNAGCIPQSLPPK